MKVGSGSESRLTSPDGQRYHVRYVSDPSIYLWRGDYWSAGCNLAPGGTPEGDEYGMVQSDDGWAGMDYVEFEVPVGCAPSILKFYEDFFGSTATMLDGVGVVAVGGVKDDGGCVQSLVFREVEGAEEYDGHHIAVYVGGGVAGFKDVFSRMESAGLVWVNPRFSDKAANWEGAEKEMQFRFKDFVVGGEKVWECEHEVRCSLHKDNRSELE